MIYAVVDNGIVENVIVADEDFTLPGKSLIPADGANIGDTWDGSNFIPAPPAPVVLENLTMRQFRLGLRRAGLLSAVEAALAAMTGPEGEDARIEFEYASEVERGNALVSGLAGALGLTDAQIDALWVSSLTL